MAANYLHGSETVILDKGPRPIRVVKSSVIALVGIAPKGPAEALTLVQSTQDAAQFGALVPGFNIPRALESIFAQGGGAPVLIVNVYDKTIHTVAVIEEAVTVEDLRFKTFYPTIENVVVKSDDLNTTYIEDQDYTWNQFGEFIIPSGSNITEGDDLKINYRRLNGAAVTSNHLIGTITSGVRTGMQLFDEAYNTFGFNPKIIIAPGYSQTDAVAAEMLEKADKFRGHALIDAAAGTSVSTAISNRNIASGTPFATSSKRAILCFPMVKAYEPYEDQAKNFHLSQFAAGLMANVDLNEGYWVSPSNHELRGVLGMELPITAAVNDASTDANLLNEVGIVTIFAGFGSGYRLWGNRSAAWPTNTAPSNFINVQRVADLIHESIELAMLQFIDKPINNAIIDSIKESVNAFIRTLIQRGALIDGNCSYDPNNNPPTNVANGQLVFDLTFMPPTPAERITFQSFIDINLLQNLGV